jgi:hypothetical protein
MWIVQQCKEKADLLAGKLRMLTIHNKLQWSASLFLFFSHTGDVVSAMM